MSVTPLTPGIMKGQSQASSVEGQTLGGTSSAKRSEEGRSQVLKKEEPEGLFRSFSPPASPSASLSSFLQGL